MELPFLPYGIFITTDHNGKLRVGKHRAFGRGWPPDKTSLKIGDKLPTSFPVDVNIEWTGNSIVEFKEFLKKQKLQFRFEAKKAVARTDTDGSIVTYMSPEGAAIHYNVDRIITQIEGTVLKEIVVSPNFNRYFYRTFEKLLEFYNIDPSIISFSVI